MNENIYNLTQKTDSTIFGLDFYPFENDDCLRVVSCDAKWSSNGSQKGRIKVMEKGFDEDNFSITAQTACQLTPTKVSFCPVPETNSDGKVHILTSSDILRLYEYDAENNKLECQRNFKAPKKRASAKHSESAKAQSAPPLTSFDWNQKDTNLVVVSSVNTTCSVWNLETNQLQAQLIAHDKAVYDVSWVRGTHVFASAGADGSVRLFDLRALDHSTIAYETASSIALYNCKSREPELPIGNKHDLTWNNLPLLRLSWNTNDPNYAATFCLQSRRVILLDIRVPALPVAELLGHSSYVTGIAWSPTSATHIYSVGYDGNCMLWDVSGTSPLSHLQHTPSQQARDAPVSSSNSGNQYHQHAAPVKGANLPVMALSVDSPIESFAVHKRYPEHVILSSKEKLTLATFL